VVTICAMPTLDSLVAGSQRSREVFRPVAENGMVFPDHAEYVELVRFTEIPPARFFRGLRIEIIGRASTTTFIQAGAGELLVMLDRSLRASGRGLRAELIPQINGPAGKKKWPPGAGAPTGSPSCTPPFDCSGHHGPPDGPIHNGFTQSANGGDSEGYWNLSWFRLRSFFSA